MTDLNEKALEAAANEWPYATRVTKKRDGLLVTYGPHVLDVLNWHEGIAWRLTKKLPRRMARAALSALGKGEG